MRATLQELPAHSALWRGDGFAAPARPGLPTGFAELDAALPGGGWPAGSLTELIATRMGLGELSLLLPALARLSRAGRWVALVAPPHLPYAPALAAAGIALERLIVVRPGSRAEAAWALRQAVGSGAFGLVVGWLDESDAACLRRLQLASEDSGSTTILFRPPESTRQASPASLRALLSRREGYLMAHILKRRGSPLAEPLALDVPRPGPPHALARAPSAQSPAAGLPAWRG